MKQYACKRCNTIPRRRGYQLECACQIKAIPQNYHYSNDTDLIIMLWALSNLTECNTSQRDTNWTGQGGDFSGSGATGSWENNSFSFGSNNSSYSSDSGSSGSSGGGDF